MPGSSQPAGTTQHRTRGTGGGLGGIALLLLVALTLSASTSPTDWSRLARPGSSGQSDAAVMTQRLAGAIVHVQRRTVERQRVQPRPEVAAALFGGRVDSVLSASADRPIAARQVALDRLNPANVSLPPPARA
jgi:hypothetical protein